jgi:hypothetical protein
VDFKALELQMDHAGKLGTQENSQTKEEGICRRLETVTE